MVTEHKERIIETEWAIEAPVADVWRALTDAQWLTNWFPTEARITPGVGGSVWTAWSAGGEEFEAAITEWDEQRRLKLVYAEPTPPDEAEAAHQDNQFFPFQVAADYHLEARGGSTVLRLVHTGFSEHSDWDWQYHATSRGWKFELGGLKHYLEKHRGVTRTVIQARHALGDITFDVAWQLLFSATGLAAPGAVPGATPDAVQALREGDRYALRTESGDTFEGEVHVWNPPQDFAGTVENLNDARLRIKIDQSCAAEGTNDAVFFLSTYDLPATQSATIQSNVESMFETLYATAASTT